MSGSGIRGVPPVDDEAVEPLGDIPGVALARVTRLPVEAARVTEGLQEGFVREGDLGVGRVAALHEQALQRLTEAREEDEQGVHRQGRVTTLAVLREQAVRVGHRAEGAEDDALALLRAVRLEHAGRTPALGEDRARLDRQRPNGELPLVQDALPVDVDRVAEDDAPLEGRVLMRVEQVEELVHVALGVVPVLTLAVVQSRNEALVHADTSALTQEDLGALLERGITQSVHHELEATQGVLTLLVEDDLEGAHAVLTIEDLELGQLAAAGTLTNQLTRLRVEEPVARQVHDDGVHEGIAGEEVVGVLLGLARTHVPLDAALGILGLATDGGQGQEVRSVDPEAEHLDAGLTEEGDALEGDVGTCVLDHGRSSLLGKELVPRL